MLTTLLFIAIIISCKSFTKLNHLSKRVLNQRLIPFSKTKQNVRLTSTTFYDDKNDKRKKYNYNYYSHSDTNFNNDDLQEQIISPNNEEVDNYETLYTLIWFDCEDCMKLLSHIKNHNKKIIYINGSYYFFDENDETNTPLFYKNDELLATDLFSIYEELFYNKIM